MRMSIAAAAAFLLSGCWFGDNFYRNVRPSPAIAPGAYMLQSPDRPEPQRVSVTIGRDGMTTVTPQDDPEEIVIAGFAPLSNSGGAFVAWQTRIGSEPVIGNERAYGVAARRPGGEFHLFVPMCGETRELALSLGARIEGDSDLPLCRFPNRASLERALRRLIPRLGEGYRLVPVRPD